jgi:DNA polymerase elongation subunit (family B)
MMLDAKKRYEQTKSKEDEKLISRYHNLQLAKKIQLNSAYGALGNRYFRWFSFDNAEAITTSGQLSIRWIESRMNEYMNKICKTKGVDYVIASDTDSIYVTFKNLIPVGADELESVKLIDEFCETKIQSYINSCYDELAGMMNAYQQKMQMKRETIANKAIWKEKKMYILNAWNIEGVQFDKPKLKMSGIEAVRSSTPKKCRDAIKTALEVLMNQTEPEFQKFIADFKLKFMEMPFEEVAFPRGVRLMGYKTSPTGGSYKFEYKLGDKSLPIQVRGALVYNDMIKRMGLEKKYDMIKEGDKIKFAYLTSPNPLRSNVVAAPDVLPPEFKLDMYIDRDMQFEKTFLDPLKSITEVIGWQIEKKATLQSFFY